MPRMNWKSMVWIIVAEINIIFERKIPLEHAHGAILRHFIGRIFRRRRAESTVVKAMTIDVNIGEETEEIN